MRASKPMLATGAVALLTSLVAGPVASAQDTSTQPQQPAAAGQPAAGQKNWKDRAEYDLYVKISQTTDPKARLDLLNSWQDKYPQTDYSQERNQYFLVTLSQLAANDPASRQKLLDKSNEILKADPKNFRAAYFIVLYGPQVGGTTPSADVQSQVDTAAHAVIDGANDAFDASKKPAQVAQADFDKAKTSSIAVAHNALAWEATSKKDLPTAESEYKASLQSDPSQPRISAAYGQMLVNEKKFPEGLWQYAHAGQYDGPGALPPATRTQLLDYFNKVYTQYHGSDDGKQALLDQAKTAAVAPDGFQITSAQATANQQTEALQSRINSDPGFKVWYSIKQTLQEKGDAFFNGDIKDVELPGETVPSKTFSGTIISVDPAKVTLGVEDPAKPDATLEFSQPLPASAMDKVKVGEKLEFSGIAESYVKDPYMLAMEGPAIPGVQTAAPAKKGTARRRH